MRRAAEANGYTTELCERQKRAGGFETMPGYHYCLALLADGDGSLRGFYEESCRPDGGEGGGGEQGEGGASGGEVTRPAPDTSFPCVSLLLRTARGDRAAFRAA